jgi:hypothetical protein
MVFLVILDCQLRVKHVLLLLFRLVLKAELYQINMKYNP